MCGNWNSCAHPKTLCKTILFIFLFGYKFLWPSVCVERETLFTIMAFITIGHISFFDPLYANKICLHVLRNEHLFDVLYNRVRETPREREWCGLRRHLRKIPLTHTYLQFVILLGHCWNGTLLFFPQHSSKIMWQGWEKISFLKLALLLSSYGSYLMVIFIVLILLL